MAKFNYKELARSVASSKTVEKRVITRQRNRFILAKERMLQDFDNHPVTKEIEGGIASPNISKTLPGVKNGELFSYIGFEAGTDPVSPVRDVLETETALVYTRKKPQGTHVDYIFELRIPRESIQDASPMPWESGQSWVRGIERGISGFGHYLAKLFNNPPSRSEGGVQVENQIRGGSFKTRPYLSEIFQKFVNNFKLRR